MEKAKEIPPKNPPAEEMMLTTKEVYKEALLYYYYPHVLYGIEDLDDIDEVWDLD